MGNDLRVIKTERAIREAFISLVEEKGYGHVTIRDITTRAMINRNTFYLHYQDKADLLRAIVHEVLGTQQEKLRIPAPEMTALDQDVVVAGLQSVLNVIYEEVEFYRILLTDDSLGSSLGWLRKLLKDNFHKMLTPEFTVDPLAFEFACSGLFGIIEQWIIYDNATIREISATVGRLFLQCIRQSTDAEPQSAQKTSAAV